MRFPAANMRSLGMYQFNLADEKYARSNGVAWLSAPSVLECFHSGPAEGAKEHVFDLPDEVKLNRLYRPRKMRFVYETQAKAGSNLQFNMINKNDQRTKTAFAEVRGAVKTANSRYPHNDWRSAFSDTNGLYLNNADGQANWKCGAGAPIRAEIVLMEGWNNVSDFIWRLASSSGNDLWDTWGMGKINTPMEDFGGVSFDIKADYYFYSFHGEIWQ